MPLNWWYTAFELIGQHRRSWRITLADKKRGHIPIGIHPLFLFQAGRLLMRLAHQSPASSTILSIAAFRPSGFLPPAVAKWG